MIIKNGIVADPASGLYEHMDILVKDGKIVKIAPDISYESDAATTEKEEIIDASGMIVGPGLIDTHVHFRDPGFTYKEDIHTGSLAAAKGGFTTVVCMANTKPTVDNVDTLKDNITRGKQEKIRMYQAAAISHSLKGQDEVDMAALKEAGACGFTDDGIPLTNAAFCYRAMQNAAKLDMPISLHEEDPAFIKNNGINHGKVSDALGIYGSPSIAEETLVARDCLLALRSGADVVIQHISSGVSVDIVRTYKKLGARLHAEATPHHFTLTEDAVLEHGTLAKMNPPLRTEADRQKIIDGLIDGTIDLIATDHAPHSAEEKSKPVTEAPSGIIGLETSLALGITSLVKPGHLSMLELLEKMTINPARLYHMPYGTISEGAAADFVLPDRRKGAVPHRTAAPLAGTARHRGRESILQYVYPERVRAAAGHAPCALKRMHGREGRKADGHQTEKKKNHPPDVPAGPRPVVAAADRMAGNAGRHHRVRPCDAVQCQLYYRLSAHGQQPALYRRAADLCGHRPRHHVRHKLCGPSLSALGSKACLLGRAGAAGVHFDLRTAERLPPLDPDVRRHAADLRAGKI